MSTPPRWTDAELRADARLAADIFRQHRLSSADAWAAQVVEAQGKFEALFAQLGGLTKAGINAQTLSQAFGNRMGEAQRYLAGPPISDDDLDVLADVESTAPAKLAANPEAVQKVYAVIERVLDPFRFPWLREGGTPSAEQLRAAVLASSVLLASQRLATKRRNDSGKGQESEVMACLAGLGYQQVRPEAIATWMKGPQTRQFCGECLLGERKADVVVRLDDTRLLAIECKVSNSSTNSVKRLNNDAAVKAGYWRTTFGTANVVPAAVLAGVFKPINLDQAQERGLALFWSHDLDKLAQFVSASTG